LCFHRYKFSNKRHGLVQRQFAANGQVLLQVGNFLFVRPEQLLIENTSMKLRLIAEVVCPARTEAWIFTAAD